MAKTKRTSKGNGARGGFGSGGNMGAAMQKMQTLRTEMAAAQAEVAEMSATGEAGVGSVKVEVTVTGAGVLTAVKIAPELLTDGDADIIEDLIVAAAADATANMAVITEEKMGKYAMMLNSI